MTDTTLTLAEALREAIDYARLSPNGERRKRWEAALDAARAATEQPKVLEGCHPDCPECAARPACGHAGCAGPDPRQ
jgi:hypothetical protein